MSISTEAYTAIVDENLKLKAKAERLRMDVKRLMKEYARVMDHVKDIEWANEQLEELVTAVRGPQPKVNGIPWHEAADKVLHGESGDE